MHLHVVIDGSIYYPECLQNQRQRNDRQKHDHLAPVLQMFQIVVVLAEGAVRVTGVVRFDGSFPVLAGPAPQTNKE